MLNTSSTNAYASSLSSYHELQCGADFAFFLKFCHLYLCYGLSLLTFFSEIAEADGEEKLSTSKRKVFLRDVSLSSELDIFSIYVPFSDSTIVWSNCFENNY